jgi:hypothetical protein
VTTTKGNGSIFSVYISRIPLQDICRMGPRFQEGTKNKRHVTKYIRSKDNMTFEETVKADELFQKVTMIPDYELQYEINTNRTECEYHVNIMRTLSHKVKRAT